MSTNTKGIFVPRTKTFYYMDNGPLLHNNNIEKLRRILLMRELITVFSAQEENPPRVITLADALDKGYTLEPIYPTAHLKEQEQSSPHAQKKKIGW